MVYCIAPCTKYISQISIFIHMIKMIKHEAALFCWYFMSIFVVKETFFFFLFFFFFSCEFGESHRPGQHYAATCQFPGPVAKWLRVQISLPRLNIRSSHGCVLCGIESHMKQAMFCLQVCQVFFSLGSPVFAPSTETILKGT